jgi:hypothetical protein
MRPIRKLAELRLAARAFSAPALAQKKGFLVPVAIAILVTLPAAGFPQSRPDFTGEWVLSDSAPESRSVAAVGDAGFRTGSMGSGWGSPLILRQQANQVVVEFAFFGTYDLQPRLRFTFALDGSESRNAVMIGHAESVLRSRVGWHGDTLVITTDYSAPAGANGAAIRQALSLASPASLVIETTRPAAIGAAPGVTRSTYSKR